MVSVSWRSLNLNSADEWRADLAYSTRFGTLPVFPCLFASFSPYSSNIFSPPIEESVEPSILQTLRDMSATIDQPSLSIPDKKAVVDTLYHVQYRILRFLHTSFALIPPLEQAFHLAALIYTNLFIRELPARAQLHDNILSHLSLLLSSTIWELEFLDDGIIFEENGSGGIETGGANWKRDMLLWIVYVAVAACRDEGTRMEFVGILNAVEPGLMWTELGVVRERLKSVVWRASKCEVVLQRIWGAMMGTAVSF